MTVRLGIDIGSTSIKVCLVENGIVTVSSNIVHDAKTSPMKSDHPSSHLFDEQCPKILLGVLDDCLRQVRHTLSSVSQVSVTGAMHGVVLWKVSSNIAAFDWSNLISIYENCVESSTNLITWQDQRCDVNFLDSLSCNSSFCNIYTGYGIATLLWLQKEFNCLDSYNMCGTIMDFTVWLLTQTEQVKMTPHNAKSWGFYDHTKLRWETEQLSFSVD